MTDTAFDIKDFRRALSQFPTGVTVITARDAEGQPVGVTASSFNSVSIDPPLILWSIDKGAHSLSAFEKAEHFAVNVLGRDQVDTSNRFASRGEDKFKDVAWHSGLGDAPVLDEYAAQFECKTWAVYEGGDHLILVGEVKEYRYDNAVLPLVFSRGGYAVSAQHPAMAKTMATETEGDFVGDYLLYLLRATYNRYCAKLYPKLQEQCNISPEEWRIVIRLTDHGSLPVAELSGMVMQPEDSLRTTVDLLIEKGLVSYADAGTLSITEQGQEVGKQLQDIAHAEEAELLSLLPDDQAKQLKGNLKTILEKLSSES